MKKLKKDKKYKAVSSYREEYERKISNLINCLYRSGKNHFEIADIFHNLGIKRKYASVKNKDFTPKEIFQFLE